MKLYRDEEGIPKGDGRCTYFKRESVDLALKVLDGSRPRCVLCAGLPGMWRYGRVLRDNKPISVQLATFQLKGQFDPAVAKKNKLTKAQKKLAQEKSQKYRALSCLGREGEVRLGAGCWTGSRRP